MIDLALIVGKVTNSACLHLLVVLYCYVVLLQRMKLFAITKELPYQTSSAETRRFPSQQHIN